MTVRRSVVVLGVLCSLLRPPLLAAEPGAPPGHPDADQPKAAPRCGNGRIEPPETCDDGNTNDGDDCPSNCRIEACTRSAERFEVSVALVRPRDTAIAGVVVLLDYPEGEVMLPGAIGERSVAERISHVPTGFASVPYDLDYALKEAVVLNRALPPGDLFHVSFDRCEGVPAPRAEDFHCRVQQASTPAGQMVPTDKLRCSVRTS